MSHCAECGHDWSRDVDTMAERSKGQRRVIEALRQRVAVLEELLEEVRQQCLFDDDDGQIGVSEDVVISSILFDRICKAIATTEGE